MCCCVWYDGVCGEVWGEDRWLRVVAGVERFGLGCLEEWGSGGEV